jgi:hypothetical protein
LRGLEVGVGLPIRERPRSPRKYLEVLSNMATESELTETLKSRSVRDEKKAAQFYSSTGPPFGRFAGTVGV